MSHPPTLSLPLNAAASSPSTASFARRLLQRAAATWLVLAIAGQLLFAWYLVRAYALPTLRGDFASWNLKLSHGYTPGDVWGNTLVGLHLGFALLILVGGALQLLPPLRRARPALHRGIGRAYLCIAGVLALGGLLMMWTRPVVGDWVQHLGLSLNALLILVCAGLAWRAARARRTPVHQAWALRLFLLVSGVWFFRLVLPLWIMVWQAPVGFDPKTFSGPFLSVLSFAQSLVPLAVFELLRWAQRKSRPGPQLAVGLLMILLDLLTVAGIAAAYLMLWRPHL